MADVTVRRIECDGCGAVQEDKSPRAWTTIAALMQLSDGSEKTQPLIELCNGCAERAFTRIVEAISVGDDESRARRERLKGGTVPRGWP